MKACTALVFFCCLSAISVSSLFAQPAAPAPQTARQALIEMMTGGQEAAKRHLTVEMQKSLETGKGSSPYLSIFDQMKAAGSEFQAFETGEVLLSTTEPTKNGKFEVHVDNDDLSGDTDNMDLSFHQFQDGVEQDMPYSVMLSRVTAGFKRQAGIWRLNEVSVSIKIPVGDPKLMEKMGYGMPGGGMIGGKIGVSGGKTEMPREMPIESTVSLMALAEGTYANLHPETGFTCSLADLAENNPFNLSAKIFSGESYQGYKFALSGCQGKPAESFHLVAEPVTPGAKAYCTDATHNIRSSDDGRGATCLLSGKANSFGGSGGMFQGISRAPATSGDKKPPQK